MFELAMGESAVSHLVEGAIDEVGASPRRWVFVLVALLVGVLGFLWWSRRITGDVAVADPMPADRDR